MNKVCRVPGCSAPAASGYSPFCRGHKAALRRHGDASQKGITAAELRSYLQRVQKRIEKNRDNPLWGMLEANWRAVVGHASGILAAYERGVPGAGYERTAAFEVQKLDSAASPHQVVEVVLAMFVMQSLDPHRFRSDKAFRFQLARRARALADVHAGTTYDHQKGTVRRVYRELSPRAMEVLGLWLAEALGGAGLRVGQLDLDDMAKRDEERRGLRQALDDLE